MSPPFLIIETGQPVASMRRHGSFAHWIRVAAGLGRDDAILVDVERGDALPERAGFAGAIITGSAAMVTERRDWSERSAGWLREAAHAGLPLLGICYGHQLIAHALGGEVGDNPNGREMGTVCIELADAA
ncbi:MAG: gamma-glutamyl-gamma-aminobutyrate hydrolase family protein, partial [Xanthomonadales bacterium]|nr:gamma-glutamyl-gamma-aminobutyrate hydrolase family protein [Xanthomonadales bacterium]